MKKFLVSLFLIFIVSTKAICTTVPQGFVDYEATTSNPQKTETLLVLPLDMGYFNPYQSTYSSIMNTISGDIINTMNNTSQLRAMSLYNLNYKIKQNKLEPDLKRVIATYKSRSVVDYRTLRTLCNVLHTDKVILISGDFDPTQFIFKPKQTHEAIPVGMIKPAYQINTLIMLVDPQEEEMVWENIYRKSFTIDSPQTDFEHNAISVRNMRRFSKTIATSVINHVSENLVAPEAVTSVNSYIVNTTIKPTEGITTKDGLSFSTVNKYVKKARQKCSDWSNEGL